MTFDPVLHRHQSKISKWVVKQDRGQWVRRENEYLVVIKKLFLDNTDSRIYSKLLRIPYDHILINTTKPLQLNCLISFVKLKMQECDQVTAHKISAIPIYAFKLIKAREITAILNITTQLLYQYSSRCNMSSMPKNFHDIRVIMRGSAHFDFMFLTRRLIVFMIFTIAGLPTIDV